MVTRDVVFKEHIFPFSQVQDHHVPIFPTQSLLDSDDALVRLPVNDDSLDLGIPVQEGSGNEISHGMNQGVVDSHDTPTVVHNDPSDVVPRNSSKRAVHPPVWMKDYVTHVTDLVHPYLLATYMSYDHLSTSYQAYLSEMSVDTEPSTYEVAVKDQRWVEAMKQEIEALESNGTWKVMSLPPGKRAIGCKWVFKIKYKANREVDRFKARLVAKGYSQTGEIDYQETFSSVVKMVTVRSIIAIVAAENWKIFQMNVFNTSSLRGNIEDSIEEVS